MFGVELLAPQGRAEAGNEIRRERAPVDELQVVRCQPRFGQGRPVRGRGLRRQRSQGSGLQQQAEKRTAPKARACWISNAAWRMPLRPTRGRPIRAWATGATAQRQVQVAQDGDRHASGHGQPERQPAAELPAAGERRRWTTGNWRFWRRITTVDGGQQRRHCATRPWKTSAKVRDRR